MPKSKNTKILLTGGHAATMGIAVTLELKKRFPDANIVFVGSKSAVPGTKATTTEFKVYPSLGIKFYPIMAGKLQTKFTRNTIPLALLIPVGFLQALVLLLQLKPGVILSFGGFASFPIVFWGRFLGISVIVHEQTVVFGRASKASAPFATKIALARKESLKFFPNYKSVVTGNPLLPGILSIKPKIAPSKDKVIFINVGSRGSEFIGDEIYKVLPELLKKYEIYHIAGENNFQRYKDYVNKKYHVFPFVDPRDIGKFYEKADVVIGRAGASTVSEILYLKRPALLIPLPRTFMGEQYKNAEYAKDFGVAKVMSETEVTPISLISSIDNIFLNWSKIVAKVRDKESPDASATEKIVNLISDYIQ